jgi:uncharacterized membrane protein
MMFLKKLYSGFAMLIWELAMFISLIISLMELSVAVGWKAVMYLIWAIVAFVMSLVSMYAVGDAIEKEEKEESDK